MAKRKKPGTVIGGIGSAGSSRGPGVQPASGFPMNRDDFPEGVRLEDVTVPSSCDTCIHRKAGTLGCDAFEVIPLPIAMGQHAHTTPYPGDHGIQYAPIPGK